MIEWQREKNENINWNLNKKKKYCKKLIKEEKLYHKRERDLIVISLLDTLIKK